MGWAKSATTGRRKTTYQASMSAATLLREPAAPLGAGTIAGGSPAAEPSRPSLEDQAQRASLKRQRRALPVYDVATGQDLETPVNLDNTLLQAMFPDLQIALGQVPPLPPRAKPEQVEAHWQAALDDLTKDLARQEGLALDVATGARKEGRFLYTDGQVGRQVADTFE